MFERFTERARQVVVLAQEEARRLRHNYIGTEHLAVALMLEGGLGARVLGSLGISVEDVRRRLLEVAGEGDEPMNGQIPFMPTAKKVLELALREALSLGHNYIGAEHILLGLVREQESPGARILRELGADEETVNERVVEQLSRVGLEYEHAGRPSGPGPLKRIEARLTKIEERLESIEQALKRE